MSEIVGEIKAAKFYSVLTDEVTSHNTEHLALCAWFVDSKNLVREEFLSFIQLDRITGKQIAEAIIAFLNETDITIADMRGQGYDGASNMSSSRAGVQARISEVAPKATYVHCSGHCLNLVISKSCSVPDIRHVLDRLQHYKAMMVLRTCHQVDLVCKPVYQRSLLRQHMFIVVAIA